MWRSYKETCPHNKQLFFWVGKCISSFQHLQFGSGIETKQMGRKPFWYTRIRKGRKREKRVSFCYIIENCGDILWRCNRGEIYKMVLRISCCWWYRIYFSILQLYPDSRKAALFHDYFATFQSCFPTETMRGLVSSRMDGI